MVQYGPIMLKSVKNIYIKDHVEISFSSLKCEGNNIRIWGVLVDLNAEDFKS